MSIIENVINVSKKAEYILESTYGAQGRGMHEKLTSAERYIPAPLLKKLRYVATIRNKLMHEHGFELTEPEIFLHTAKEALSELERLADQSLKNRGNNQVSTSIKMNRPENPSSDATRFSLSSGLRHLFNNAGFWFPYAILLSSALLALSIYVDSRANGTPGVIERVQNAVLFITGQQALPDRSQEQESDNSSKH